MAYISKTDTAAKLRERIAVRAYFLWENGKPTDWRELSSVDHWLCAEQAELAADHERSMRAKKAAATRKANAAAAVAAMPRNPETRRQMIAAGLAKVH